MIVPRSNPVRKIITVFTALTLFLFLYHSWDLATTYSDYLTHMPFQQSLDSPSPPKIPKKIWYKLGPKGLSKQARNWTNSCLANNPDYEAVFLTDDSADVWVQETFGTDRPDIVQVYRDLSVPILKADLLRYLLLFAEGGLWMDLDVSCTKGTTIEDWIPPQYKNDTSLLVGWEFDSGWGDKVFHQLSTWTILATKPRLPYLAATIEDILADVQEISAKNNNTPIADITMSMVPDVVDLTGPRRLTRSVFRVLRANRTEDEYKQQVENRIFFNREPQLVDDVLVLPGYSFAASMNDYDEQVVVGPPLVVHHYAGSWKNENGGEKVRRRRRSATREN